MEPKNAKHMRWHKEGRRSNPSVMVHPSDAEAWKHFSEVCPDFAMDARNVRIAMATDGFNPFGYGKTQYSCWPVFVIPLNLPPALCMREENIFLSLVILGPEHTYYTLQIGENLSTGFLQSNGTFNGALTISSEGRRPCKVYLDVWN